MPCPYFLPREPRTETVWERPPRAPLGRLFAGECRAQDAAEPVDRDECNFGYARGTCPRFPADAPADAVRFSVTAREADRVELLYILEREHAPVEHGVLEWRSGGAVTGAASAIVGEQVRAFVRELPPL